MYVVLCAVRRCEALTGIVGDVEGCATRLIGQGTGVPKNPTQPTLE